MVRIENIQALGTHWWVEIYEEVQAPESIKETLVNCMNDFEAKFSRFKPDSILSKLNKARSITAKDLEFRSVLQKGIELFVQTGGNFNFLNGHILEELGYDPEYSFKSRQGAQSKPAEITDLLIGDSEIRLNASAKVDIGGFGKGYLLDKLSNLLREKLGIKYFLLNGGGDIYVSSDNEQEIELMLEQPDQEGCYFAKIMLKNKALCCSSPYKRSWIDESTGQRYSHIISNSIAANTLPAIATYVIADTCTQADAFATAFIAAADKAVISGKCEQQDVDILFVQNNKIFKSPNFPDLLA
jgi:thiamine biosynthesis lipoprotein